MENQILDDETLLELGEDLLEEQRKRYDFFYNQKWQSEIEDAISN